MLSYCLMILSISLKYSYALQKCGNPNEPLYLPFKDTNEGKFLCPVKAKEDEHKLEELSEQNYEMEYCLWEDMLPQRNGNSCQNEVRPVFRRYEDKEHNPIRCSSDGNQFLHYFGYYYCGDEMVLEKFREFNPPKNTSYNIQIRKSRIIIMYNICFDMNNNTTAWTQHSIETPQLFQVASNEQLHCDTDIRKDPFFMDKNCFLNLEIRYKWAENRGRMTGILIKPQPLVPAKHFAVRFGQKATNHYINRAPFWTDLIPLMDSIDEGIKRAAIKASLKIPRNGPKEKVAIFTKIETIPLPDMFKRWFKIQPFERNIWYKFVYDPVQSQGIIIHIHSTPDIWVIKKKCKEVINCNFKAWTQDKYILSKINEYNLKYAYCCPITAEKANAMFPTKKFDIQQNFDIDSMATFNND